MRVVMLSWEFPPKTVGGLAQHVYDLTTALSGRGVEVLVFTCGAPGVPEIEEVNGAKVYRVHPYTPGTPDFVTWVMQLNVALLERAFPVIERARGVNVVHAHDWLVAWAARALKHGLRVPLVATIHATEFGRHNGLHNDLQRFISSIEWWLCYEAWKVIVCSCYMEGELKYIFQVPQDKLTVIPNGVNPENYLVRQTHPPRDWFAAPDEKIVFYIGRLVREKGVHILLAAAPLVLARHPQTKFVIAGKGPYEQELRQFAERLGIAHRVYFTGYVDDATRNALYSWAAVAVFPSLYEPFGIVALEAMAAKVPVVVADTGGLGEIVQDGVDGLKCPPDNPQALADKIVALLGNPDLAEALRTRAYQKTLRDYNWGDIARRTRAVYEAVWHERRRIDWPDPFAVRPRPAGKVYQFLGRYA
ncbi:glycosyltransferase family 4 protein [Thermodesulfitimonas autotrophica]|uniref:glycosyltransferase family 4 protein n=1 Tax=Thermodesulfitimonas autotrophica TaxID=1894989 RepID=UPI002FE35ABD